MAVASPTRAKRRNTSVPANRSDKRAIIALIDERPLMRHCFGRWLEENARDTRVVAVASVTEIVDSARLEQEIQLIIFGMGARRVSTPEMVKTIHELARALPHVPIVALSDHDDVEEVARAIRHGVRGYVSTKLELSEVVAALHCVEAGGTFVPADILVRSGLPQQAPSTSDPEPDSTVWENLTPREREVVARLRQGKPSRVVAYEIAVSESPDRTEARRLPAKLDTLLKNAASMLKRFGKDARTA